LLFRLWVSRRELFINTWVCIPKSHWHENCFTIWHKHADIIVEHHKIGAAYRQLKVNAGQNPKSDESSSDEHSEIPEDDNDEEEVINGDT
jgi:hypothetical protein